MAGARADFCSVVVLVGSMWAENDEKKDAVSLRKKLLTRESLTNVFVIMLFVGWLYGGLWSVSNKSGIRSHCQKIAGVIATNSAVWEEVFTRHFDRAVACRTDACKRATLQEMRNLLHGTEQAPFFQTSYLIRSFWARS